MGKQQPVLPPLAPDIIAGLSQLQNIPETTDTLRNPYSIAGTTSDSKFLDGVTYDRNPEYIKAVNQGFLSSIGNSVLQTVGGIPLQVTEGIGYLGVGNIIDTIAGTEKEFGNSFSNKMREWGEDLRKKGAPVYTTPDDEGFEPWNYKWWATNMPSIASAVSLLIPATGAVKGIGAIGKAVGGLKYAKALGITSEILAGGETIAMAAFSRHMENMMEGMGTYETLYQQAKEQGVDDGKASRIASEGASEAYTKNWPLIATDIIQFGLAFKSFKNIGRIKAIEESAKKGIKDVLTQAGLEGGEEGYQYIVGEEARRKAAIQGQLEKDDHSTYSERLMNYVANGDFWTSAFFGAIGGAAFEGVGNKMADTARAKQQIVDDAQKSSLEKSIAVFKDDPISFQKSTDVDLHRLIIAGLENGRVDKVEQMLNDIKSNKPEGTTAEDKIGIDTRADQGLQDLKYLEKIYSNIFRDPTRIKSPELIRFELANRSELRSNKRLADSLSEIQTEIIDTIGNERELDSSHLLLLKAQTELEIINNEFKDQSPADKQIKDRRIQYIQSSINQLRNTIKTNNSVTDQEIDEKLNINKSFLHTTSFHKVLYDLKIDQNNSDYDKLTSESGQKELSNKIADFVNTKTNKDFESLINRISPTSTFEELATMKQEASSLGKEKEFQTAYNDTISTFRKAVPKFSVSAPGLSLEERYKSNSLLQEHELHDLKSIAAEQAGAYLEFDEQSVADLFTKNPAYAKKVTDYFEKADGSVIAPTVSNVKKVPTQENSEGTKDNDSTVKINPLAAAVNANAWNLQAIQFENKIDEETGEIVPDPTKPAISNLSKKIDWEFLNQGNLPYKATLHFEYDFDDEWNKKPETTLSNAQFELVYYIDGNISNNNPTNRKVVGSLSAKPETQELRNKLYNSVKEGKTGNLGVTTKVKKIIGGRRWKGVGYNKLTQVLKDGQKPVIAIGRIMKLGDSHQVILDTNGHDVQKRITFSNATPGAVYVILKAPSGDFLPYKLFTHKIKEFPESKNQLLSYIQQFTTNITGDEKLSMLDAISNIADIKDIKFNNNTFFITTGNVLDPTVTEVSSEELENFVNELIVQIDVTKINKGEYNKEISDRGLISTDLHPYTHFHSTKVVIESFISTSIVSPNVTVSTNPLPKEIKITGAIKKITGAGSTKVNFTPNPKAKEVIEGLEYSPLNIENTKKWFTKNLPQVPVSIVENIIEIHKNGGVKAWGVFKNNAIELYNGAPEGTEYHEAFHAVFNMMLTDTQRETLSNEAKTLYGEGTNFEEALADDFARYVQQQEAFEGKLGFNIKNFFKKLYEFIKSIFTSNVNIDSLFYRINEGFYKNKELIKSDSIRYKLTANPHTVQRNVKTINYYFFQALNDYRAENGLGNLSDVDTIKKINSNVNEAIFSLYSNVYNGMYEVRDTLIKEESVELAKEISDLMQDFINVDGEGNIVGQGDYYMLALRDLAKYGINIKVDGVLSNAYSSETDEKQFEINEEEVALEGWQIKSLQTNPKDNLSYNVKKLLRQTVTYNKNEAGEFILDTDKFGFNKFVNFDELYNYIQQNIAGIYNKDVMLATLTDLENHRPELHGIVEKLSQDDILATQFFTNFAKSYTPFYQVKQQITTQREAREQYKVVKYNVYNANRKNSFQLLIDDWYTNLITPTRNSITDTEGNILVDKAKQAHKEFTDIFNDLKKKREVTLEDSNSISSIINKFGIDVDGENLQKEFSVKPMLSGNRFVYLKPFENYTELMNRINILLTSISGGVNPYKGESNETRTAMNVAKVVAKNELQLHQDTFVNVEGEQVYSYTQPTFLHKKLEEFKSEEGRAQYLSNWWYKRNKWLQDLNEDASLRDNFDIILLDGLLLDKKSKGTKFYDMIDSELDITDMNMFWNQGSNSYAYYRLPILSDTPEAPYLRFKKYNEHEIIDALYNLALAEQDRINIAKSSDIKIKNWNEGKENGLKYQFIDIFNRSEVDINNEEAAKKEIAEWLTTQFNNEKFRLRENGVLNSVDHLGDSVSTVAANSKTFLKDYFNNKVLANAMITQLTSVDLAFYKNYDDFQKRNGQIFKFTKMLDIDANWNGEKPGYTYNTVYLKDEMLSSKELEEFTYKTLIDKGYSKDFAIATSALYSNNNINQTDAQAYITVDRYKKILIGLGNWTDKHESAYKLIKEEKAWDDSYNLLMQPIKPFYYGHEVLGNLIIPVQNKNSEVVLLPNLANNHPKLKKMLAYMNKNQVDSIQFNSAVKAGEYGAVAANDLDNAIIHTLDNKFYGIQQETPQHHLDTENLLGSQLKKLILGDIPDNAKFFNGTMTKKQLTDTYQKLLTQNIIESYNNLSTEFKNIRDVQKLLLEQVIERNLGEYFENALEIVKDQEGKDVFNLPLFHPIHAKRFENILNSVIRNNVTKQKINGGSFVLMSNFGLSNDLKVVTNEKTGAVEYMEVMLPSWTKKMFPRNPKGEVDIDYIRAEAPEILDIIGYRIPTEHKYSIKKLRVIGFTPDLMGGIAILPAEITTIAGEDFDIDKMYTMIPNFEVIDGKLQKVKYDFNNINNNYSENFKNILKKKELVSESDLKNSQLIKDIRVDKTTTNTAIQPNSSDNNLSAAFLYTKKYNQLTEEEQLEAKTLGYRILNDLLFDLSEITTFAEEILANKEYASALTTNENPIRLFFESDVFKQAEKGILNKEQRDNAIIDIIGEIWSHPSVSDQIMIPGGFNTLKEIAASYRNMNVTITGGDNPLLPATQMKFFQRNTNGSKLIGIGANHNTSHAVLQYTAIELAKPVTFNGVSATKLNRTKTLTGDKLISRNLAEFLAAFVDNAKDPVADDLNINEFTFNTAAMIVRLGFDHQTAMDFINHPIVKKFTREFFKEGGTKLAESAESKVYQSLLASSINNKNDVKTLIKFAEYKELADSLSILVRATRADVLGTGKTMASNNSFLQLIERAKKDPNLTNVESLFNGKAFPLIQVATEYGIERPQQEILSKYFPYGNSAYTVLYDRLAEQKGQSLTEDEINQVNGYTLSYLSSGFDFFHTKDKDAFINKFPVHYLKNKDKANLKGFELMRYLKFVPKTTDNQLSRVEFASGATVSNEQREIISRSWEAMLVSDNEETKKFAQDLVKYSFYTNGLSFTFAGFGHLVPTTYIDNLVDTQGLTFRDYLYKILNETTDITIFDQFIDQLNRHDLNNRLVQKIYTNTDKDSIISNRIEKDKLITSFFISSSKAKELELTDTAGKPYNQYYKIPSNGRNYTYKYSGSLNGDLIFNVQEALGYGKNVFEFSRYDDKGTAIPYNKLPELDETAFYNSSSEPAREQFQVSNESRDVNNELNNVLKQYLSNLGFTIKQVEEIVTASGGKAVASVNLIEKVIKVAKGREDISTLPEEVGHIVEAYNRGTNWHSRLVALAPSTSIYKKVKEEYATEYFTEEDFIRETVGKLIGEALIRKELDSKAGFTDSVIRIVKRLWEAFANKFRNANESKLKLEVNNILNTVTEDILNLNTDNLPTDINIGGTFYQLSNDTVTTAETLLKKGIDATYKKIKIYENKSLTEFSDRETKILNKLTDELKQGLYQKGLLDYTINAKRELRKISKRYSKINRSPVTLDEKRETLKTLNQVNNYVQGFKETLAGIATSDVFLGNTSDMRNVTRFIADTSELVNKLEKDYFNIGKPILVEILKEFSTNRKLDINVALDTLETDISYTQRWLDSLAETSDSVLSIIDVMVKDAKQRARLKTIIPTKQLVAAQKKLEKAGVPSTNFMYERDFEGNLTGRIVSEFNYGQFIKDRTKFFENNPKPKAENYKETKEFRAALRDYRQVVAKWFETNTQPHPDRVNLMKVKKEELLKLYPNNVKLAEQKYREWLGANVLEYNVVDPETGEFYMKFIKELATPSEKYRSTQFADVQAKAATKEYYELITSIIEGIERELPEQYKLNGLAPQIRKDYFERLYIVDANGKSKLKSLKEIGKETKNGLADELVRHENDIDFGLTDEANQPINLLPMNFTKRMKDTTHLSLDLTSSMVALLYSANNFGEMSKIVDTLEYTKDVLGERKVKTGKFDPITMFRNEDEKGKPIAIEGKESLAYQRLIDYMNMVVYGQGRKDEGAWGSVDKAKLADFINKYTAMNSLALNIYSGFANITMGNVMVRTEAIAGEFINNKDLYQADKIYALQVPKVMSEIGQRLDESKLTLWLEQMDTMQNYDRDFRNIDAGRNTVFSRLMKTSSLYFINHAGEHFIQSRMSLALAHNTKVKDILGNEISLWDAYDVKEGKLVLKEGIKKVGSKKGLFKTEEDGQDLTERDIIRFINRQNFINKRLHGIYNDVDKSAIQRYALGRLVIMFRKFIKPGWNKRFAKLTYNEEGEIYTEGYYTGLSRFIKNVYKEIKEGEFSLAKNWNNLEDFEKRNFFRLATEWAYIFAAITAANILTNLGGDDDDYALNFAAYEAYRLYSEMRFFTSFTEAWRITKSPAAAVYQIDRIARFVQVWNWGNEVTKGKYKGFNRFEVGSLQLIPFAGTYVNSRTPEEQLRFFTNNGVSIF